MRRKYSKRLLRKLNHKAYKDTYMGPTYTIKPVPDSNIKGIIDTRVFESSKVHLWMLHFIPEKVLSFDLASLGVEKARRLFNGVKSVDVTKIEIQKNRFDVPTSDGEKIALYHYSQENSTPQHPTLYYIHGGGFFAGHHKIIEAALKFMCQQYGFNIFSIDYRLAPEHPYPTSHTDCYTALNWIIDHAEELNINKEQLFIAGDSAGGNIAQYCLTRDSENKLTRIKGQLLLYPSLNMAGIEDHYFQWNLEHYEMANKQEKNLAKMIQLFGLLTKGMPLVLGVEDAKTDYLSPYLKENLTSTPPTFFAVGEHDFFKIETLAYAAKLNAAQVETETIVYNGMNHAFFDNFGIYPQAEDCVNEMADFILKLAQ